MAIQRRGAIDYPTRDAFASAKAIGFPEPALPAAHVPDFRGYDGLTNTVACLRCKRMISAREWGQPCEGQR